MITEYLKLNVETDRDWNRFLSYLKSRGLRPPLTVIAEEDLHTEPQYLLSLQKRIVTDAVLSRKLRMTFAKIVLLWAEALAAGHDEWLERRRKRPIEQGAVDAAH